MNVDLEELERLAKAATPGPWRSSDNPFVKGYSGRVEGPEPRIKGLCVADADYIAAANPEVILHLIECIID